MNTQRWIALGSLVAILACAVTANLWLTPLVTDEDNAQAAETELPGFGEVLSSTSTPTATVIFETTTTPTLDPAIQDLMSMMEEQALDAGNEPFIVFSGDFTTIDPMHRGEGTASVFRLGESQLVLRLDPFTVTNGPDLRIILSQSPSPLTSAEALLPTHVDLGPLRSPSGAQNFDLNPDIDFETYKSVVIYSQSLNLIYSIAPLEPVRGSR